MQIKYMKKEDISEVAAVGRQNFTHSWEEQDYLEHLEDRDKIHLVARMDGSIAGSCVVWCSFETADLCNIVVAESYRRKGIAQALLQEVFEQCRNKAVDRILLEVREGNTPALELYKKMGFHKISIRKDYYREPVENAVILQKNI